MAVYALLNTGNSGRGRLPGIAMTVHTLYFVFTCMDLVTESDRLNRGFIGKVSNIYSIANAERDYCHNCEQQDIFNQERINFVPLLRCKAKSYSALHAIG